MQSATRSVHHRRTMVFFLELPVLGASNCASDNPCAVLQAETKIQDKLSISWLVFSFTLISGVAHVVQYAYADTFLKVVKAGTNYFRLADYALSASLMFMTFSILWYAPPSLEQLLLNWTVIFEVIVLGFGAEVFRLCRAALPGARVLLLRICCLLAGMGQHLGNICIWDFRFWRHCWGGNERSCSSRFYNQGAFELGRGVATIPPRLCVCHLDSTFHYLFTVLSSRQQNDWHAHFKARRLPRTPILWLKTSLSMDS